MSVLKPDQPSVTVRPNTGKPGAHRGWELGLGAVRIVGYLMLWSAAYSGVGMLLAGEHPGPLRNLVAHGAAVVAGCAVTWAFRRWVDRRPWSELGLGWPGSRSLAHLGVGVAIGLAGAGVNLASGVLLGGYRVTGTEVAAAGARAALGGLALGAVLYLLSAVVEELGWRGYVLSALNRLARPWVAMVITGVLFAVPHLLAGSSSPWFALQALVDYSLLSALFVLARRRSGTLWAAIGVHTGWNVGGDYVFGTGVASDPGGHALLHVAQPSWSLMFGGPFNADSSLLDILVDVLMIAAVVLVFRSRTGRS
jgi:hypothetical protein